MSRVNLLFLVFGLFGLALSGFASASYDAKESLMKWNRTPKETNIFSNACDECQIIIKRIVDVAKDPSKLSELKVLLGLLCRETSYAEECRLFVANIDRFIDRLLPYLKDAHAACQKMHICGSSKLKQFHRVGMLYAKKYLNKLDGAKDLICEECQFAAHELLSVVDDKNTQIEVKHFLSDNVCAHMGQYRGACDEGLEVFLPDFFTELHDLLKDNHQFCKDIELCPHMALITSSTEDSTSTESRKVSKRIIKHFLKN